MYKCESCSNRELCKFKERRKTLIEKINENIRDLRGLPFEINVDCTKFIPDINLYTAPIVDEVKEGIEASINVLTGFFSKITEEATAIINDMDKKSEENEEEAKVE